jgi:hypothetical protein
MVQFKITYSPLHDDEDYVANSYWKLGRQLNSTTKSLKRSLIEVRFYFKSSANKERLVSLLFRYKRGLLSYEGYTIAELKGFCIQRGLAIAENAKKDIIVRYLEEEDERATFTRFLDLPAELRNRIYTMHFESFRKLDLPTTPPITQVCRQLRQETLILFWQSCKAIVDTGGSFRLDEAPRCTHRLIRRKTYGYPPSRETFRLFSALPSLQLGNIRKFELEGVIATPTHWVSASWDIDLGSGRSGVHVTAIEPDPSIEGCPDDFRAWRTKYESRIKKGLEAMMAREGTAKLRRDDLQLLRRMFEAMDGE